MKFYLILALLLTTFCYSQDDGQLEPAEKATRGAKTTPVAKATIDQYRIITLERDTTYVDTSLTIQDEYNFNYLRKDTFGLLPFPNEGQPNNEIKFSNNAFSAFPDFGYRAKHFNYYTDRDIKYYSVATPLTELYYKTVMEQGHSLDAFVTLNTSERLNFSIAYKGLRSLGKYINQLSSAGNFRFTTSYNTTNRRYFVNAHFTAQDLLNGENGGIVNVADFESEDEKFDSRVRLSVYNNDAESLLKGKRIFVDHNFMINSIKGANNLYITHQFNFESKYFKYYQQTLSTTLESEEEGGEGVIIQRYGAAYVPANVNDEVRYNRMYNKAGVVYENSLLGKFTFFAEDFTYNYFFDKILILNDEVLPGLLHDRINTLGGQYEYRHKKWRGNMLVSNSISNQSMSHIEGKIQYTLNDKNNFSFQYQKINKLPDHLFNLHQSSFFNYNWVNDFKNEKINNIRIDANTQWLRANVQFTTLDDRLFFSDDNPDTHIQIVTPKQYGNTINYLSAEVGREFRYGKFALDNTLLYQQTDQEDNILNVPQFVTRNTLYFSSHFFKRALYLQTGVIFNYFTEFHANDYNPVIGEFFVQDQRKIGNFPVFDFFVNARIQQTRIFIKAEHFNSAWTGNNFYSAPNYPYRDFIVRFGLVWNFFQ
ncbi:MAG TPA: putative porin [Flavobacterium sp.]|jgi:hypothetical protein|nr:putative porin [Flavobacterium sp.]